MAELHAIQTGKTRLQVSWLCSNNIKSDPNGLFFIFCKPAVSLTLATVVLFITSSEEDGIKSDKSCHSVMESHNLALRRSLKLAKNSCKLSVY